MGSYINFLAVRQLYKVITVVVSIQIMSMHIDRNEYHRLLNLCNSVSASNVCTVHVHVAWLGLMILY